MSSNQTPHLAPNEYSTLRTGGSLKDGWSYLVPNDDVVLHAEVSVKFSDEALEEHVREQKEALKSLYLSSHSAAQLVSNQDSDLLVEEEESHKQTTNNKGRGNEVHFIVQRGLQVVGCATMDHQSGEIYDVAIKPSAQKDAVGLLISKIIDHQQESLRQEAGGGAGGRHRSGSLRIHPRSAASMELFQQMGFVPSSSSSNNEDEDTVVTMELNH